ncbi:EEIG1/EHBP1 N-terminal domain-containing protein [Cynara cardunculus var. scolymus]|uniref:EEIG1/EHBP1 N-terminal domain-containing protein n=1 Tax=Cynara cardunculus var. scolymus TaxID=59895 RepID=A0A118JWX0_CYNCS|nr:EEIG1/EHBP1 N-terminal domain-containing protein [Cynara cardunculus var. scolymus]
MRFILAFVGCKILIGLFFLYMQLTQIGGDALTISVIPGDVGKPTARLEKAKVRDGTCYWEKPHYETVKYTRDQKTGKFNEKIYRFVVATGSSIFGVVGEVSVDFASYAEATKLSSLSLPLKNAKSTSVLHMLFELGIDPKGARSKDHEALNDNINRDRGASIGSDITLSCSDSSSGLDTPREPEPKNTKLAHESSTTTISEEHPRSSSQWDWLDGSTHELSTDDSSMISPGETLLREISEEGSPDDIITKLKAELVVLARQADVSDLELQTLRKQIVKEGKKGQDLSREVANLKEERNALKDECEKMKAYQKNVETKVKADNKLLIEGGDPWALVDELRQELNYEKDLNSNLRLQLQKTQESNAELILAVRDLDEMLEQKDSKCSIAPKPNSKSEIDDDEDQKALEEIVREHSGLKDVYLQEQKIIDLYAEVESYKRDKDELEIQMEQIALDYEILKQENHDMSYKLEQSQLQEQLKMQYECSTSYATVNELESQIENLDNELKMKSKELSESILAIRELETHVKNLEEDLENQAHGFEVDVEDLMHAKVEQEQRAIRAEENLRKVKLQNASTAGKLQEEFRRLSTEMSSAFQENENAAMKAMDEANQLRVEKRHLEETVKKVQEDLRYLGDHYEDKLVYLSNQITVKSKQIVEMEKQIENMSDDLEHQETSCRAKVEKLKAENQNLEGERKDLENEVRLVKTELESSKNELSELRKVKNEKEHEVEKLQSETERLKSRCNEMKLFFKEYELEKENLRKQVSQLKGDLKKKDEAMSNIEKKLKDGNTRAMALDGNKTIPRNNKPGQIKLKETALERCEASFLEKEKDLQQKIEELVRRLKVLDQNTENQQVTSEHRKFLTKKTDLLSDCCSDDEIKKTGDEEMSALLNINKSMEVELKEMQERYSEISLKFAEVEGERQQLVMSLRNLKNTKKC